MNVKEQSTLDTWKELQYGEHMMVGPIESKAKEAEDEVKSAEARLQADIDRGLSEDSISRRRVLDLGRCKAALSREVSAQHQHKVLLRWIDEQVSLMAEGNQASHTRVYAPKTKRKRVQLSRDSGSK